MSSRGLQFSNFLGHSDLSSFSNSTPVSRSVSQETQSSPRCSSSAASTPYSAFRPPIEMHRWHIDLEYRVTLLRTFCGYAKARLPLSRNGVRPLVRAHSNQNGYIKVETSKSGNRSLLLRPPLKVGNRRQPMEELIDRAIFDCRFFTLMATFGSLAGSLLCFCKGCGLIVQAFSEYMHACLNGFATGQVILLLVEAVDIYLMGTVMLIFGVGIYELFVSNIAIPTVDSSAYHQGKNFASNWPRWFQFQKRPLWLEIPSLDDLKTKLGHVIVLILMVATFEKSRYVPVNSGMDLLFFAASTFMSSGCLFLLSKLNSIK